MALAMHRVRRQSWRVTARSADAAFGLRVALRAQLEDALLPIFGEAFDAAAPGDAVVRIPKLELRLRVAHLGELASAVREALERELAMPPPAPPRAAPQEWRELLMGYLESGTLAWQAMHVEPVEAAAQLRAALPAALEPIARRGPSASAPFARRVEFYFRLLQLLPQDRWPEAAECVTRAGASVSGNPAAAALAALRGARLPPAVVHRLAAAVLAAAGAAHAAAASALREELSLVLAAQPTAGTPASQAPAPAERTLAARVAQLLPPPAAAFFAARIDLQPSEVVRLSPKAIATRQPEPRPLEAGAPHRKAGAQPQAFALAACNAGLVLLHPFLPQLFESCSLYRQPHSLSLSLSLPRAAALLHWLATGREEVFEFELGFVKLLLGMAPAAPLPFGSGLLGAAERDEGAALLQAAIGHWKALGGTSIDGLRLAFLQRRGALREEEAGWRLRLEPESYDVLLGQLPWGLATVKLPWMTRPLYTDWPTL